MCSHNAFGSISSSGGNSSPNPSNLQPGFKWCTIPWPDNLPCPYEPQSHNITGHSSEHPNHGITTIKQTTIEHLINFGLIDFDIKYENDQVIVTIKVAGANLGTLRLGTENNCGTLEGKVDIFGVTGAKVEVKVCVDFQNRKVCAEGKAYIHIPWPVNKWKEIGSFEDCIGF